MSNWTDHVRQYNGHLEHCDKSDGEGVEMCEWDAVDKVEFAAEQLHPQQGKYEDKEEKQKQQWDDTAHGAE